MQRPARTYRFAGFILSSRRRTLTRDGADLPLIPRYFDLLVFLVEHRHEAVHRRDIFDKVWTDVIVSDSALSQAIRTIRRTLGDDSREPRFIRTVSRHGYQFIAGDVAEDDDESPPASTAEGARAVEIRDEAGDPFEPLLLRLLHEAHTPDEQAEQRDAAERLHALGTAEALKRLDERPHHAHARALLRDTRWNVPGAEPVPLLGSPGAIRAAFDLVIIRLRAAARLAAARGASAALGGGGAGIVGGLAGGVLLAVAHGSDAPVTVAIVLSVVGAAAGALGACGVGGGMALGESASRSQRVLGIAIGAGLGGAVVGALTQWLAMATLAVLFGVHVAIGGTLEGLLIGLAAGLGYGAATSQPPGVGLAAPRGGGRLAAAVLTAWACLLATLALSLLGRPVVGGTLHLIAQASAGSQVVLTPLARLIGEPAFGRITQAVIAAGEGALFGFGLVLGMTRR